MNVLSLFDGISCGYVALKRAGIPVSVYMASEIDQYAIKIAKKNHPDIIHLGDVTKIKVSELPAIPDLVIGGSPCQGFSFSGKGLAFDDPRSRLFFEFVRIVEECRALNPNVKFMLENVNMKKEHLAVITETLGVQPMNINSNLVSAQNRNRWYWANWSLCVPEDKGLLWPSVQIENAENVMFYSEAAFRWIYACEKRRGKYFEYSKSTEVKMQMIEASHHKGYSNQRCFGINDNGRTRYIHPVECERLQTLPDGYTDGVSNSQRYRQLGNGWTVDVVAHIFNCMKETNNAKR